MATLRLPFFDEVDCFGTLKASMVNNLDEEMGRRQLGPQEDISRFVTAVKQKIQLTRSFILFHVLRVVCRRIIEDAH